MPIAVVCACGARLQAPDAAAGKRVKCPKCQNPLVVPAPAMDYEVVEDEPAPAPAPVAVAKARPKPQLVEDDDEAPRPAKKKPRVVDEEDEKPRKKSKPVEVDEAVDDDEEDAKPKKSRRDREEENDEKPAKKSRKSREDDEEDEDEDAPKKGKGKKKAKSNLPLLLGVGGGVLVLAIVGVIVGVVMMNGNSDQTKGTNTTPGGTQPTQPQLPTGWKMFKGEGFSVGLPNDVTFPDKPDVSTVNQPPAVSSKQWTNRLQAATSGKGYEVTKVQLTPEFAAKFQQNPAAAWEELMKEANKAADPKPTITTVTFAGLEGRQVKGVQLTAKLTVRIVVKGDSIYAVAFASKTADETDPAAAPFFDSFRIEDTGPAPPPGGGGGMKPSEPQPLPTSEIPNGWKKFQGEGFSTGIPAAATMASKPSNTKPQPPVVSIKEWTTSGAKPADPVFLVNVIRNDDQFRKKFEQDPAGAFESVIRGLEQEVGDGKKARVKAISRGGVEGRQFITSEGSSSIVVELYIKDSTLFMFTATVPSTVDENGPKVKPFFDAIRFEK